MHLNVSENSNLTFIPITRLRTLFVFNTDYVHTKFPPQNIDSYEWKEFLDVQNDVYNQHEDQNTTK
jgi:hypothetical protein